MTRRCYVYNTTQSPDENVLEHLYKAIDHKIDVVSFPLFYFLRIYFFNFSVFSGNWRNGLVTKR